MINSDKGFERREGLKASGAIGRDVGCMELFIDGARGGTRTPTPRALDPKSSASANSATLALRVRAKTTSHPIFRSSLVTSQSQDPRNSGTIPVVLLTGCDQTGRQFCESIFARTLNILVLSMNAVKV